jgi:hypothetical protein
MRMDFSTTVAAIAIGLACAAGTARAQDATQPSQPTDFESWRLPGWTFTPGVVLGALHDSNVAIAFPSADTGSTASDKLLGIEPFGQLEYYSPRTTFSSGYHGFIRDYFTYDDLNAVDHRAFVSFRRMVTRRVTVFLDDNYLRVPTTDQLELNGIPFQRVGSQYESFAGGAEARLSKTTDLTVRYDLTWVDFAHHEFQLNGGAVNGATASLSHRFTDRASLGAEYGTRYADLTGDTQLLRFQNAGGVFRYRTGDQTTVEVAGGLAHLVDHTHNVTRSGPYVRASFLDRLRRATVGVDFERNYVPSLAFGGTNQSQELRGYVEMPLSANRFYVQESASWRRTDPFDTAELPLDSIWLNTVVGYSVQRWIRVEGYYAFTRQDTRLAGGQINRNVIGVQLVVSEPVRIQR